MSEYNIPQFYQSCKSKNIKVIGNSHGNEDNSYNAVGKSYDSKMDFTTGGIPANDTLKNIKCNQKHILIIANFLGNRSSIYPTNLDNNFIQECGALELSKEYNSSIKYVKDITDCEVITNTDNIDQLIADSAVIISAPSTLAFKPIQLGIPTVLIKGSGAVGDFKDYPGLTNLNKQEIFNNLQMQIDHGRFNKFIKNTLIGGVDFNSSEIYIKNLKKLI